jgi:DNA polymerase-3 subunit gamma/tau
MSFYQKYRPTDFGQVIGQDEIKSFLKSVAKKGDDIPHAYIFCGGHGIGKTTLARIFAKELGSDESDIYELDAASNRGIDEIRSIKENVYTLPLSSKYKVYILDEAHALTKDAGNAILKVLEEPPKHAMFIFCTTDPEKMLPTVRSRCQILNLEKPKKEDIVKLLKSISKEENISLNDHILNHLAHKSKGSIRDAITELEYYSYLEKTYEITDQHNIENIILSLIKKDFKEIIKLINEKEKPENVYKEILDFMHEGMIIRQSEKLKEDFEADQIKFVTDNASFFTSANLLYFLEKERLFYDAKDKKIALMAILGSFLEKA